MDPTVESGGGDLQTIQIDDYVDLDSSLHQESNVDPESNPEVKLSSNPEVELNSNPEPESNQEQESNQESDLNDSDDMSVADRSTETITATDFVHEERPESETETEHVDTEVEVEPGKDVPDVLTTLEEAERKIVEQLLESKFVDAVQTYRKLKTRWPNVVSEIIVGNPNTTDDIWAMLNMYCSELSGERLGDASSFFAMTVADSELADNCSRLMTASMQVTVNK